MTKGLSNPGWGDAKRLTTILSLALLVGCGNGADLRKGSTTQGQNLDPSAGANDVQTVALRVTCEEVVDGMGPMSSSRVFLGESPKGVHVSLSEVPSVCGDGFTAEAAYSSELLKITLQQSDEARCFCRVSFDAFDLALPQGVGWADFQRYRVLLRHRGEVDAGALFPVAGLTNR